METIGSILSDPDMSKVTSLPPIKPKAGNVFVIESINMEDWKCDQYLWIRDGGRTIKVKDVEIGKVFYKVRIPGIEIKSGRVRPRFSLKFKKVGYWLTNRPTLVLVHYIGDETIYTPMAHGKSIHDETVEDHSDSKIEHSKPTTSDEKDSPIINTMFDFPAFVSSQHALAKYTVDNNLITLVPSQGAFIGQGRNAKISIGQEPIEKRTLINLGLLTKNNSKRVDKKSGKKQLRQNDYDPVVEPAPDSAYLVNTLKTPSQVHPTHKSPHKSH
ncbi:unnamed protein product [Mytilus coruscus]|uniref:CG-1 domain-containing protein n=1 Tax=Mytilus coruscus TaxID=42192 RepID=A0A6J8BES2_MYTCO|nr:unnamed protein product [Mytilus coruscus]